MPEKSTETGQPIGIRQRPAIGTGRLTHSAELDDLERLAVQPWASLAKEDGATEGYRGRNRDCPHDRRQHNQRQGRKNYVSATLGSDPYFDLQVGPLSIDTQPLEFSKAQASGFSKDTSVKLLFISVALRVQNSNPNLSRTAVETETQPKTILIVGGVARSLVTFRLPLLKAMISRGYHVTAAAGDDDSESIQVLNRLGIDFVRIPLGRTGMNPIADTTTIYSLYTLMRSVRPEIFFGYTIKPVVYGLIAARIARVPRRIVMITGLGYAFTEGTEFKRRIARTLASTSYRIALRSADRVIFQNPDDRAYFLSHRLLARPDIAARVNGSGVDLTHYLPAPLPTGPITFLMIARLLRDKGVYDFVEAARIVKRQNPEARFVLVGPFDTNPSAVQPAEVQAWVTEGNIIYRGELRDVRPKIAACHVYVLPSYREGMPRTVLEAMAMGRPIITTDVPGCRETVVDGKNGILVPARKAQTLAEACLRFVGDPTLIATAGVASQTMARKKFDARSVADAIVQIVNER